jgi:hypothetical protein
MLGLLSKNRKRTWAILCTTPDPSALDSLSLFLPLLLNPILQKVDALFQQCFPFHRQALFGSLIKLSSTLIPC